MDSSPQNNRTPAVAELLDDAFVGSVGVETAARHLWVIHMEAARLENETVGVGAPSSGSASAVPVRRERSMRNWALRMAPRAAMPVLALMMVLSTSGVALAASQRSLPGDVLYPVKRGSETAQLILTRNTTARVELRLSFARNRLDEIRQIGQTRPEHIPDLVTAIADSLDEVERTAPEVSGASEQIRRQTGEQLAQLQLPGAITEAVGQALTAASSLNPSTQSPATEAANASTITPIPTPGDTQTPTAVTNPPMPRGPTTGAEPTATDTTSAEDALDGGGKASETTATDMASDSVVPSTLPSAPAGGSSGASGSAPPTTASSTSSEPSGSGQGEEGQGEENQGEGSQSNQPEDDDGEQIITPRPHASEDQGSSRSGDGSADQIEDPAVLVQPTEAPSGDGSPVPFSRATDNPPSDDTPSDNAAADETEAEDTE